jgi:hypothetical protein
MRDPATKAIFDESSDSTALVVCHSVKVDHVLPFRPAHESSQSCRFLTLNLVLVRPIVFVMLERRSALKCASLNVTVHRRRFVKMNDHDGSFPISSATDD